MPRKVVVTGMGIVSCLGTGLSANWDALTAGRSGIGTISLFDASSCPTRIAGEVRGNMDPTNHISDKEIRRMDRFQQFAVVAAGEAVQEAGLPTQPQNPYRYGVVIGSGMGGLITIEEGISQLRKKGARGVHPFVIPKSVINLAPGILAIRYGFKGPNLGVVNACASGSTAIGEAFRIVRDGRADAVITGGAEAVVTPLALAAFSSLRALSTRNEDPEKASRPFDRDRDGFVISEGAGMMLLESEEHARNRGATVYAEIVGYGATDDAYHYVMPDPQGEGAYWAMKTAIEDAGIEPAQIGYINAHGTSTPLNDRIESIAIKSLFGRAAHSVAVSSTKSMTGHLIGAAGGVEAIFAVMALRTGVIPPTINLENPDPECDLDYTPNQAGKRTLEYALSNTFAFGGQNASLLFKRVEA